MLGMLDGKHHIAICVRLVHMTNEQGRSGQVRLLAFNNDGKHELKSNFWSEACAGRPALLFLAAARPVALLGEQLHQHL